LNDPSQSLEVLFGPMTWPPTAGGLRNVHFRWAGKFVERQAARISADLAIALGADNTTVFIRTSRTATWPIPQRAKRVETRDANGDAELAAGDATADATTGCSLLRVTADRSEWSLFETDHRASGLHNILAEGGFLGALEHADGDSLVNLGASCCLDGWCWGQSLGSLEPAPMGWSDILGIEREHVDVAEID
jgi:hypothetical protein